MTPEQQEEFEKAVQQHIQLAVNAALANMPQQPPPPAAAVTVNAVAVKLPEFWTADPNTWFSQAEASFRRSNVTPLYTKYDHVLMKLPCDVVMSVRDLVNSMQPNTPDAYEQLKARLTDSYPKTRWQQVFALIDLPALGDRRPSHLMNEMLALLPTGSNKDDSLFLGLFLWKLPTTMRDHLAAADHQTATSMAKHPDVLWDARCGEAAVTSRDASEIDAVNRAKNASRSSRSPDRRRSHDRHGESSLHRKPTPGPDGRRRDSALCFYHNKWGSKAQKCQPPCSWAEN